MGGESTDGCCFTPYQMRAFRRVYGILPEVESEKEGSKKNLPLREAGATRNLFRSVKTDGMRLMGILAKFCEVGEDPAKVLVRVLLSAGYDIGDLAEWAEEDGSIEEGDDDYQVQQTSP